MKRRPLAEQDEIVTCLSPEKGKFDAVAKGSRKSSSRLIGLLEPSTHLHAQFARGKSLDPLTQAKPLTAFSHIRTDLDRLTTAAYLLQLFNNALPDHQEDPSAFFLLLKALKSMDTETIHPPLLKTHVELHLAIHLGYAPNLRTCAACHAPARHGWFSEGHITCPQCGPQNPNAKRISRQATASLNHLTKTHFHQLQDRKPPQDLQDELDLILNLHLRRHLNVPKALNL